MKNLFTLYFTFLNVLLLTAQINLGTTTLKDTIIAENLDTPWEILWGPDGNIWFTERKGTISKMDPQTYTVDLIHTVNAVTESSEAGMLGLALHPDFNNPDSAFVYVVYTYIPSGSFNLEERLSRFKYDGNGLINETIILDNVPAADNHSGSRIIITPDRKILMTTGDALNTSLSQNMNSLAGKILRINLDGSIPSDNPFTNSYVYTYGHRNAQGLVWATNGILYSSEHGPSNDDEINIITADKNYGWPNVQGFCNTGVEIAFCNANDVTEPIRAWTPTLAVAGLDYYDHDAIPEWKNTLLLVNLKERDLRALTLATDGLSVTTEETYLNDEYGRLRDLCISPTGDIYITTSNRDGRGSPVTTDDRIVKLFNPDFIPTGTSKENAVKIQAFPNPTTGSISISQKGEMKIYDAMSTLVIQSSGKVSELNISNLPFGIYLLEVNTAKGILRSKIIKE